MIPRKQAMALVAALALHYPAPFAAEQAPISPAEVWLEVMAQWLRIMTEPNGTGQMAMIEEFRRLLPCGSGRRNDTEPGSGESCPVPPRDAPE